MSCPDCGCGSDCKCGTGVGGCKMYPELSKSGEKSRERSGSPADETAGATQTKIVDGVSSKKTNVEGSVTGVEAPNEVHESGNGCKCSPCNCDPCNC